MTERRYRRLPETERRAQLEAIAVEQFAARAPSEVTLEDVARAADVTRNLLYRYFPDGHAGLYRAAVQRSCAELVDALDRDPDAPADEKMAANALVYIDHVQRRSPAFRVLRAAGTSTDPEVQAIVDAARWRVLRAVAANQLGTDEPGPRARLALRAYAAFFEQALVDWHESEDPAVTREELQAWLNDVLRAALELDR